MTSTYFEHQAILDAVRDIAMIFERLKRVEDRIKMLDSRTIGSMMIGCSGPINNGGS